MASKEKTQDQGAHSQNTAGHSTTFVVVTALICAVIGACAVFVWHQVTLAPASAAANVDGEYIDEADVEYAISQYRTSYSLTDDADFASSLASNDQTVLGLRQNIINQIALDMLVSKRADELGIEVDEDEIQEQIDAMKSSLAFDDDEIWEETLSMYGMSEESIAENLRVELEKEALLEQEVPHEELDDETTLTYAIDNLASVTQRHFMQAIFEGDDALQQAQSFSSQVKELQEQGTLTAESFYAAASTFSTCTLESEQDASLGWSVELESDTDLAEILSELQVGDTSDIESADSTYYIAYCDESYSFPDSDNIENLQATDLPETLWAVVKSVASDEAWDASCDGYLANLLTAASITYYPMPSDASYNVDMTLAS